VTTLFNRKRGKVCRTARLLFPTTMDQHTLVRRVLDVAHIDDDREPISLNMEEVRMVDHYIHLLGLTVINHTAFGSFQIARICYAYRQICDEHPFLDRYFNRDLEPLSLAAREAKDGSVGKLSTVAEGQQRISEPGMPLAKLERPEK